MTLRERLRGWLSHDTHPAVQFLKYGMAGGAATATDIVVFFLLSWLVLPGLTPADPVVRLLHLHVPPLDPHTQATHYVINRCLTFLVSNLVAYLLNVLFVFKPGRHSKLKEFGLFYLVSGVAFALGTGVGTALIVAFAATTTAAFLANLLASLAINYAGRKFFVFKG